MEQGKQREGAMGAHNPDAADPKREYRKPELTAYKDLKSVTGLVTS